MAALMTVDIADPATDPDPVRTPHQVNQSLEQRLVDRATELLENHPHFRGRHQSVYCEHSRGALLLQGTVPSYYLKQLAQEAIRDLVDVIKIVNQIRVSDLCGCTRPEFEANRRMRKPR